MPGKNNGYLKNYTILIIDDENMTHIILKALLNNDYNLLFANNAQQGIDLLGEHAVNLILLDVQLPEISGVELLESLMIDSVLRDIPVIIMTGKATEEIEKKSRNLGAVDFVKKTELFDNKQAVLKQIDRKISANAQSPKIYLGHKDKFRKILKVLLTESIKGDFISASRKLGIGIMTTFQMDYISFWTIAKGKPNLIVSLGDKEMENFGPSEIISEEAFRSFAKSRKPYLSNHPGSDNKGFFPALSLKVGLSAEIGVPLYAISKEELINNNMKLPFSTPIFGFIIMKRSRVFNSREFKMISKFLIQAGTILFSLYKRFFQNKQDL